MNNVAVCTCRERARRRAVVKAGLGTAAFAYLWFARTLGWLIAKAAVIGILVLATGVDLAFIHPIQETWCWTYGESLAFVVVAPFLAITAFVGWVNGAEQPKGRK